MENRFFSLIIVPDSGHEVRSGSFNHRFVLGTLSSLAVCFFVCLFFIIGYHIKLSQEKNYQKALSTKNSLMQRIVDARNTIDSYNLQMKTLQDSDLAYRHYAGVTMLPDSDMYLAGIGGHILTNATGIEDFPEDLKINVKELFIGLAALESRVGVQEKSYDEVNSILARNKDVNDNTPCILPTESFRITSRYGSRKHPIGGHWHWHSGLDLGGKRGEPIRAAANGVVTMAKYSGNLGRCVKIKHKYGYETVYAHLHTINVKVGDKVNKRDIIGSMGSTGRSTGTHLHYEVIAMGKHQNPLEYITK